MCTGLQVFAGDPVCVKADSILRKGPGAQHAVSWKVARYMPFLKTESKSGWSKVEDLEGEAHWIKTSDITTRIRCVVVKTNIATLRREPATASPPVDLKTVDKYTPFKRINNEREWLKIEDESGRQAWIHESQVWKPVKVQSFTF